MTTHPSHRRHLQFALGGIVASVALLAVLLLQQSLVVRIPRESNAGVHTVIEIVSIVVSCMVGRAGRRPCWT